MAGIKNFAIVTPFFAFRPSFFFFVDIRNPNVSAILVLFYRSLILALSLFFPYSFYAY